MKEVKITLEHLERLLKQAKNEAEYSDMRKALYVSIKELPNGDTELQFEQPCQYAECNSTYYRYTNQS
jgi:hypothetical protein